jgi:hypothetical protein
MLVTAIKTFDVSGKKMISLQQIGLRLISLCASIISEPELMEVAILKNPQAGWTLTAMWFWWRRFAGLVFALQLKQLSTYAVNVDSLIQLLFTSHAAQLIDILWKNSLSTSRTIITDGLSSWGITELRHRLSGWKIIDRLIMATCVITVWAIEV